MCIRDRGKKKRIVDEVLSTLEGIGVVNLVAIKKATYLLDPQAKVCGNCRKFMTPLCKLGMGAEAEGAWDDLLSEEVEEDCFEPR